MTNFIHKSIKEFDYVLKTLFTPASSERPYPGESHPEPMLTEEERKHTAALLRINHTGEVCAQALYQGQRLTCKNNDIVEALTHASEEEVEHLAWTETRLKELGARKSLLNPVWYAGSLALGLIAGKIGDRWNLGFLAETEHQVVSHLESHCGKLPETDQRSRAILEQMKQDEQEHADLAIEHGGSPLPAPIKKAMRATSKIMTKTTYYL